LKIVIDISVYQDCYVFWKFRYLVRKCKIDGVIIRAGCGYIEDRMLSKYVHWCRLLKIPFGLYYYFYPGLDLNYQVNKFIELARKHKNCKNLWIDVEEFRNYSTGDVLNPDHLNGFYKSAFMNIKSAFPAKVVGNYSGGWVLNPYIPQFYTWAKDYPYWNADYAKYYSWYHVYMNSLGANWDNSDRPIDISLLPDILAEISRHPVMSPIGMGEPQLWQCITYLPFKQLTYWQQHLDWNITTVENFELLFGEEVV